MNPDQLTPDSPRSWKSLVASFAGDDARWRGVPKPLGDRVVSINIARVHEMQLRKRNDAISKYPHSQKLPVNQPTDEDRRI